MKRRMYVVMVVCVLMSMVSLKADYPVFPICTAEYDQTQPDIDGDWVVWQDARNGSSNLDIFGYTLAEPNEIQICTVSSNQQYPAVSANTAVWVDLRNSQRDIHAFDLQDRTVMALPNMPLNDNIYQRYPDVSGARIVYQHRVGSYYNVHVYDNDLDTVEVVSESLNSQTYPVIDGSVVVWMEQIGAIYQIFTCDLSNADPALQVSVSAFSQWFPAVSGNIIVWAEDRGTATGMDLYGFDVSNPSGGEFPVYVGSGDQNRSAISGSLVIWQDESKGSADYDIWGCDLTAGSAFAIASDTKNDQLPAISGRRVVWQRANTDWDIVGAEIPAPTVIEVTSPVKDGMFLAGSDMVITWQLAEGTAPDFVDVTFSSDNGQTWPVTVASDIAYGEQQYNWSPIADVNAIDTCLIRVSDIGDTSNGGTSEAFSIFQCDLQLTADLTGDCFVGIDDFAEVAAQWLVCGNPHDAAWCYE